MNKFVFVVFLVMAGPAMATDGPLCPDIEYAACYNQDLFADLDEAGARDWEIDAIDIITSGAEGKTPTDLIETDCGAHGWAHFTPGRLQLGTSWKGDCAFEDPEWIATMRAVLYSEHSSTIQLYAWRRIVSQGLRPARRAGCSEVCLTVMAAVSNSSPTLARTLGEAVEWDLWLVIDGYEASRPGNAHRERRAEELREFLRMGRY